MFIKTTILILVLPIYFYFRYQSDISLQQMIHFHDLFCRVGVGKAASSDATHTENNTQQQ